MKTLGQSRLAALAWYSPGFSSPGFLQHRHNGVAGFAFAGFVDGDDAEFPFFAAFLIGERDFGFHGECAGAPGTFGETQGRTMDIRVD